ncbi:MAG: hypothetical protein M3Y73_15265 [Actinomycetota bacterium]|nr:hypothetical protein [Actinomycetota bacterium]
MPTLRPTTAVDVNQRLSLPRLHRTALRRAAWLADRPAEAVTRAQHDRAGGRPAL